MHICQQKWSQKENGKREQFTKYINRSKHQKVFPQTSRTSLRTQIYIRKPQNSHIFGTTLRSSCKNSASNLHTYTTYSLFNATVENCKKNAHHTLFAKPTLMFHTQVLCICYKRIPQGNATSSIWPNYNAHNGYNSLYKNFSHHYSIQNHAQLIESLVLNAIKGSQKHKQPPRRSLFIRLQKSYVAFSTGAQLTYMLRQANSI